MESSDKCFCIIMSVVAISAAIGMIFDKSEITNSKDAGLNDAIKYCYALLDKDKEDCTAIVKQYYLKGDKE